MSTWLKGSKDLVDYQGWYYDSIAVGFNNRRRLVAARRLNIWLNISHFSPITHHFPPLSFFRSFLYLLSSWFLLLLSVLKAPYSRFYHHHSTITPKEWEKRNHIKNTFSSPSTCLSQIEKWKRVKERKGNLLLAVWDCVFFCYYYQKRNIKKCAMH